MQQVGAKGLGTRENLSDYYMEHFSLSPGKGGDEHKTSPFSIYGGGGGGVLVNGEGPTRPCPRSGMGEGYGGGGSYCNGLPGVILIEVGP